MLDSDLAKELGIRGRRHSLDIQWFGGRAAQESTEVFNIEISGVGKNKSYLLRNVYAVVNLGLPMQSLRHDDLKSSDKSISSLPSYAQEIEYDLIQEMVPPTLRGRQPK